jgi:hypothetical protein
MDKRNERLIWMVMGLVVALISLRFLAAFRFLIFIALGLALVGFPIYWLWQRYRNSKSELLFSRSLEGRVNQQLDRLVELADKNKEELDLINTSLRDIQHKATELLSMANRQEIEGLLLAYKKERQLRMTKQDFFAASQEKLGVMLKNKQIAEDLATKKAQLDQMREEQFEELAELETIHYDIETDIFYLDAIDELSEKILAQRTSESADTLKLELEKMTEKLKAL